MEIGKRLREARERAGFSLTDVKQRTDIGESSLSEFEHGKRDPKVRQLTALAAAYSKSLSFFLSDEPDFAEKVLWRLRPSEGAELHECRFLKLCAQYRRLEEWTNSVVSPQLPSVEGIRNYADVEGLAMKVGRELNLGDRPAFVLLRTLEEECGVKIFHEEFEPSGTAACARSERYGWAVLLNGRNVAARRNFDLAHELFHLLAWNLYRGFNKNPSTSTVTSKANPDAGSDEQEERYADKFASCLLLPGDALKKAVDRERSADGNLPLQAIPYIAKQFGVSMDALLWRIHWVYNFGQKRSEETRELIEKARRMSMPPLDADKKEDRPAKYPERYHMLAAQALRNGELSLGTFMEYTGIPRKEAMTYQEEGDDVLGEVQLTVA